MIKDVRFNNPRSDVRAESIIEEKTVGAAERSRSLWFLKSTLNLAFAPDTLTIPELEQSKAAVLNTLASVHSRRCYASAIDRFIAWYCSEPRLTFNRAVVVRYRSHLEGLSLYASTINSHLSAIRRLADESAESGWLTPQMAIGIRRVQGRSGWVSTWARVEIPSSQFALVNTSRLPIPFLCDEWFGDLSLVARGSSETRKRKLGS
jgi:hypothetical protein